MARALASGRSIARPRPAAASLSAEIRSMLFCLATTMLGLSVEPRCGVFPPPLWGRVRVGGELHDLAFVIPPSQALPHKEAESRPSMPQEICLARASLDNCRLMRSVGRRGSHRLRIRRRLSEEALITSPFHDPVAGGAMTVADKLCLE